MISLKLEQIRKIEIIDVAVENEIKIFEKQEIGIRKEGFMNIPWI